MSSENRTDLSEIQTLWDQASALFIDDRYGEAIRCLHALESRLPNHPQLLSNLGVMYRDGGDLARAEQYLRRVCAARPDDAPAHFNLAVALLRAGRWREGFREYEWRWQVAQFAPQIRRFAQPVWRGEPLEGKRILLWGEQGAGDGIQFLRYAPMVRSAGGAIILEVLPHVQRLATWMEGNYRVVNALTQGVEFDVHCPLMSLPERFGTEVDSIPPPTCFAVPAEARTRWSARLQTGRRNIGLVWAANPSYGNNSKRSVPGHLFGLFLQIPGVQCWGLQVGSAAPEAPEGLVNLAEELTDFAETAAAIRELDLVITVDTAVAHLAGSLGKPVWVLLSYASDWRWLMDREDTPWYPTMRLFRQEQPGAWGEVIERAIQQLLGRNGGCQSS